MWDLGFGIGCGWWVLLAWLLAFLPRTGLSDSFETKSYKGGKQECGEQDGMAHGWMDMRCAG